MSQSICRPNRRCRRRSKLMPVPFRVQRLSFKRAHRVVLPYAVNNGRAIQVDVVGQSPHQSLKSLLRRADYTCSGVRPPSVSRADVKLEFDVVDAQPRLYAKYSCHDGLVLKDRTRQFMYCLRRKWIGVLPTCVIGRPSL